MSTSTSVKQDKSRQLFGEQTALYCLSIVWSASLIVTALAIISWGQSFRWQFGVINSYLLFPVLGLVAFSLMWAHYLAAGLRRFAQLDQKVMKTYFESTSWIVLVLICLHPGLLIYQRFRDGAGLPPHSYETYVLPGLGWVTLLGSVCLLVFLAFELYRWYRDRAWWKYMEVATDLAMIGIFYHGLRLGSQIQQGWYHQVWWFYGITLAALLIYKYWQKYAQRITDKAKR